MKSVKAAFTILLLFSGSVWALGDYIPNGLVYVENELLEDFDSCESGKIMQFQSGNYVKCRSYESIYSYYDEVKIFISTPYMIEGNLYAYCPMLIDERIIEVDCTEYVRNLFRSWIICSEEESWKEDTRNWCRMMLHIFSPKEIIPKKEEG